MTNYTWNIANLDRILSDGYVYTVHWTLLAENGEYSASCYGSIGLERPENEMIPFESLTKDIVIQWIKNKLGDEKVHSMESSLELEIENKKFPKNASGVPWNL